MQVDTRISETPGVAGGYPCVGDTRVRVGLVVESHRRTGSVAITAEQFDLTVEQVQAALDYYERNRDVVDKDIVRNRRREGV